MSRLECLPWESVGHGVLVLKVLRLNQCWSLGDGALSYIGWWCPLKMVDWQTPSYVNHAAQCPAYWPLWTPLCSRWWTWSHAWRRLSGSSTREEGPHGRNAPQRSGSHAPLRSTPWLATVAPSHASSSTQCSVSWCQPARTQLSRYVWWWEPRGAITAFTELCVLWVENVELQHCGVWGHHTMLL